MDAWGPAGTYHELHVLRARYPPCTCQSPNRPQTGSPTRTYCSLVPQRPELLILHADGARNPRMEVGGDKRIPCNGELLRQLRCDATGLQSTGLPAEYIYVLSACVGGEMGSESLAHAVSALQTQAQLLGSLEITHRGPSCTALMQALRVLTDLSLECREVLSSGKVLQFSQRQPAPEATQAKRQSERRSSFDARTLRLRVSADS